MNIYPKWMNHIFASVVPWAMASTTKKHVKNVHRRMTVHISASRLQALFSMLVIDLSLLFIRQYLICLRYLLELKKQTG